MWISAVVHTSCHTIELESCCAMSLERPAIVLCKHGRPSLGVGLQVVREWLPSCNACLRINVDATSVSNVAHFFNHSCDGGNLVIVLVRVRGSPVPLLGMFARRDIVPGEELTFCYGKEPPDSLPISDRGPTRTRRPCFCGSHQCTRVLPAAPV